MVQKAIPICGIPARVRRWEYLQQRASFGNLRIPERLLKQKASADALLKLFQEKKRRQKFLDQALHRYSIVCNQLEQILILSDRMKILEREFLAIPFRDDIFEKQRRLRSLFSTCRGQIREGNVAGIQSAIGEIEAELAGVKVSYFPRRIASAK